MKISVEKGSYLSHQKSAFLKKGVFFSMKKSVKRGTFLILENDHTPPLLQTSGGTGISSQLCHNPLIYGHVCFWFCTKKGVQQCHCDVILICNVVKCHTNYLTGCHCYVLVGVGCNKALIECHRESCYTNIIHNALLLCDFI